MSYVERNLLKEEKIEHLSHLHWKVYIIPALILILDLLVMLTLLVNKNLLATGVCALIAIALIVIPKLVIYSSEFVVTNKRVVIKVGIFRTRSLELFLNKLEGIAVNQGVFGKMLGYGEIVITGSGGTKEPFSGIEDPLGFRKAVQQATDQLAQPRS